VFNLKALVIENNIEISEAIGFFCSARKDIDFEAKTQVKRDWI
jgi:hypothetical protein